MCPFKASINGKQSSNLTTKIDQEKLSFLSWHKVKHLYDYYIWNFLPFVSFGMSLEIVALVFYVMLISYLHLKNGSDFNMISAFAQMGYRFSPTFTQNLLNKYDPKTKRLTLDNFIVSCVQIKRLTDSFRTRDQEMKGE